MTDWSSAELGAAPRALLAADKPLLLGNNRLRGLAAASMQWRSGADPKWSAGVDGTSASTPSTWLADGYTHKACAAGSAETSWGLLLDLGALVTFDAVAVIGHNFGSIGGLTVALQVATANTYATPQEIAAWSPASSTKRLVDVNMDHVASNARVYTAQYVRLLVSKGSAFTPQIGELILSTRRQLKHNPSEPWDPSHVRSTVSEFTSGPQVTTRYVHARGQRIVNADLVAYESAYRSDLLSFWRDDIDEGTRPFVWMPTPQSDPQDAPLMHCPAELEYPWVGPSERAFRLVAAEQGSQFVGDES